MSPCFSSTHPTTTTTTTTTRRTRRVPLLFVPVFFGDRNNGPQRFHGYSREFLQCWVAAWPWMTSRSTDRDANGSWRGACRFHVSLNKALLGAYFLGGVALGGGYLKFPWFLGNQMVNQLFSQCMYHQLDQTILCTLCSKPNSTFTSSHHHNLPLSNTTQKTAHDCNRSTKQNIRDPTTLHQLVFGYLHLKP